MAHGETIEDVIDSLSRAIEKSYKTLGGDSEYREAAVDSLREMDKLITLYRGNLPQTEFCTRLAQCGSNLFNDWISQKDPCSMKPEIKAAISIFQRNEKPPVPVFIDTVNAMRDYQNDWVYAAPGKPDPIFVSVLNCARICRRICDLDLQR